MDRRTLLKTIGAAAPAALAMAPALATPVAAQAQSGMPGAPPRTIRINGADLHYSMTGEGNRTPLIVLHGGRGFGTHNGVFSAFSPLGDTYRVIGFDQRGHGQSSVTGPFTFDQLCDDIETMRMTLGGGGKLVLHGGSFGGFIALSYAMRYPDSLSALILRGTAPSYRQEVEAVKNLEARTVKAPMATKGMLDKLFGPNIIDDTEFRLIQYAIAPLYLADNAKPDYDRIMETSRRTIYRAQVHNDLYRPEVWRKFDVVDRLQNIKVPTLIVCGETDWICDPVHSRLMASKIPNSKLVILPGIDHSVPGDVLEQESRAFLRAHSIA